MQSHDTGGSHGAIAEREDANPSARGAPESSPAGSVSGTLRRDVLVRATLWVGLVLGGGYLLHITATFIVPLVFAGFLGILFSPVADFLEERRVPPVVTTALSTLAVLSILALFGLLVGLSAASISSESETYVRRATALFEDVARWGRQALSLDSSQLFASGSGGMSSMLEGMVQPATNLAKTFAGVLFTVVYFAFLLHWRSKMAQRLRRVLVDGSSEAQRRERAIAGAATTARQFLWMKLVISVATGLAIGIASLALGLDFPLVWGLIAFAFNFIPSIGPMLAVFPAAAVALLQGGWAFGLLCASVMAAIHFSSGNVIEPMVLGSKLRLNFVVVLLSLFVWGLVWGFAGMVLAVPITAAIKAALDQSGRTTPLGLVLDGT